VRAKGVWPDGHEAPVFELAFGIAVLKTSAALMETAHVLAAIGVVSGSGTEGPKRALIGASPE